MKDCKFIIDLSNPMAIATYQDSEVDFDIHFPGARSSRGPYVPIAVHVGHFDFPEYGYEALEYASGKEIEGLSMDFLLNLDKPFARDILAHRCTGRSLTALYLKYIIDYCREKTVEGRPVILRYVEVIVPSKFDMKEEPFIKQVLHESCGVAKSVLVRVMKRLATNEDSPLEFAIKHGDEKLVNCLIRRRAPINVKNRDGYTPFALAMLYRHYGAAICLLKYGAEAKLPDDVEEAMLHCAIHDGYRCLVHRYLEHIGDKASELRGRLGDALVRLNSDYGDCPSVLRQPMDPIPLKKRVIHAMSIHNPKMADGHLRQYMESEGSGPLAKLVDELLEDAVDACDPDFIGLLIRYGADVRKSDSQGRNFLMKAAAAGSMKEVQLLLSYGFALEAVDDRHQNALYKAVFNGHVEIAECLLRHGAVFEDIDGALREACDAGNTVAANFLRGHGATDALTGLIKSVREYKTGHRLSRRVRKGSNSQLDRLDAQGMAPLHRSVVNGSKYDVLELLEDGASVDVLDKDGLTPLQLAANAGKWGTVQALLSYGAAPDVVDKDGNTPLLLAAKAGDWDTVDALVLEGSDLNAADKDGDTPLLLAAKAGKWDILGTLAHLKADLNAADKDGDTPLLLTAKAGKWDILETLAHLKADLDAADKDGDTPLLLAAKAGKWDIVETLAHLKADLNAADKDGDTPLLLAAKAGKLRAVETLVGRGASLNVADKDGNTPVTLAAKAGKWTMLDCLMNHGAAVNVMDSTGNTPLLYVAAAGNVKALRLLVRQGASIKATDADGRSAMILATLSGEREAVKYMAAQGLSLESADSAGRTALMHAITAKNEKMVVHLLCLGASTEASDISGRTPLVYAISTKRWNIVKILLQYGASPSAKNAQGKTASSYAEGKIAASLSSYMESFAGVMEAAASGNLAKIKENIRKVGSVDAQDTSGKTPLMVAAKSNQVVIVKYLLGRSAAVHIVDKTGTTALQMALEAGATEAAKLIENYFSLF